MRKLSITKERLTELTTDDLERVAAAGFDAPGSLKLDCIQTLNRCTTAITCPRPDQP